MKNKFKYLGAAVLALAALSAQATTIFQDDFSTGITRWDLTNYGGNKWFALRTFPISASNATLNLDRFDDWIGEYSSLISPVIDLTNINGAELTFMQRLSVWKEQERVLAPGSASVQVAQLGTNNWITVWSSEIDVVGTAMTMTSVDLSAFDGQKI